MDLFTILLAVLIGGAGAWLALKVKVPGGAFLGPVVTVAAYQVCVGNLPLRITGLRLGVQIAAGIVIGSNFAGVSLESLKKLLKPTLAVSAIMVVGGLLNALVVHYATGFDVLTSILSTSFGGQTEMVLISESIGAEKETVLVMQLIRMQMVLLVILQITRIYLAVKAKKKGALENE